jgi:ABC-type multidrug transport system fused ATPase/permease subunit
VESDRRNSVDFVHRGCVGRLDRVQRDALSGRVAVVFLRGDGASDYSWNQILFVHRLNALSERATEANWDLEQQMLLTVDAKRPVRIFGSEKREQRRFASASGKVRRAMYSVESASARMYPVIEFLHAALFLAALLTASTLGMDVPTIVTFLVLFYRMQPHFLALNQLDSGWRPPAAPLGRSSGYWTRRASPHRHRATSFSQNSMGQSFLKT